MLDDYDEEPVRFIRFPLPCADGMCWGVDCRRGSRLCDRTAREQEELLEYERTKPVGSSGTVSGDHDADIHRARGDG